MDERKIHEKLDKIIEEVSKVKEEVTDVKIDQAKMRVSVDYHIKRSDLNEENIEILRKSTQLAFEAVGKQIQPLTSFKDKAIGASKLIVVLISLGGLIVGIFKLVGH